MRELIVGQTYTNKTHVLNQALMKFAKQAEKGAQEMFSFGFILEQENKYLYGPSNQSTFGDYLFDAHERVTVRNTLPFRTDLALNSTSDMF